MALKASKETLADVVAMVLTLEGTWSDDPRDRGGFHQWGISSRFFIEAADPGFTLKDAFPIYEKFVANSKMLEIMLASNNRELGYLHFILAFNIGEKRAMEVLQSWLFTMTGIADFRLDGVYGPKTEALLMQVTGSMSPDEALRILQIYHAGWYSAHAMSTSQRHYFKGWSNRVTFHFDRVLKELPSKRELVQEWYDGDMSDERLAELIG